MVVEGEKSRIDSPRVHEVREQIEKMKYERKVLLNKLLDDGIIIKDENELNSIIKLFLKYQIITGTNVDKVNDKVNEIVNTILVNVKTSKLRGGNQDVILAMRRGENEGSTFTIYSPNTTNEWPKLGTINLSGGSFNLKKDESWIFYDNSFKINDNKVKFLTGLPSEETLDSLEKSVTSLQQPESKAPKQPEKPTENTIYSVEKGDTFWKIVKEYYNNKEQPLSNNDIANIINRLVIINKARNKRFNKRYEYLSKGKETPFGDEILGNLLRPGDELELPSEIGVVIKDGNPTKTFKKVK